MPARSGAVALDNELTLEWRANFRTSTVEFLLTLSNAAWVGFGHSAFGSMVGGDVYICNGTGASYEYSLFNRSISGVVPVNQSTASQPVVANCTQFGADETVLHISRHADWEDGDPLLPPGSLSGEFIWAYGKSNDLTQGHVAQGALRVDFGPEKPAKPTLDAAPYRVVHGVVMFLSFGLLLPTGAAIAAFFRERLLGGVWQTHHIRLQGVGAGLATAGVVLAVVFTQLSGASHFATAHSIIGVITWIFMVMQVAGALARPGIEDSGRAMWAAWHRVSGVFVLGGGLAAVALGALQIGLPPIVAFAWVGITGTVFAAFAIAKACQRNDKFSAYGPIYKAGTGYQVNDFGNF